MQSSNEDFDRINTDGWYSAQGWSFAGYCVYYGVEPEVGIRADVVLRDQHAYSIKVIEA
ncbi:hypothetical protein RP726_13460 [Candidatus Methylospira mobilis]|uniref:hypothetical protein n=1 Tax=Candidatus Methylospira mobilis TaxID=1808979 RepID=UPI0028E49A68|nr:hypothetical protein [Candidatus Methylospira mobilis]WNV03457.1 hypothetical protein RP726_13460 [Candidatus Methylospira mobilis]